jgi:hypothetical protein
VPVPYAKYDSFDSGPLNNDAKDPNLLFSAFERGWRGRQGLTLVHFSAQPEPFLTPNTP